MCHEHSSSTLGHLFFFFFYCSANLNRLFVLVCEYLSDFRPFLSSYVFVFSFCSFNVCRILRFLLAMRGCLRVREVRTDMACCPLRTTSAVILRVGIPEKVCLMPICVLPSCCCNETNICYAALIAYYIIMVPIHLSLSLYSNILFYLIESYNFIKISIFFSMEVACSITCLD